MIRYELDGTATLLAATPIHVNGRRMFPLCRGRFPGRLPLIPGDRAPRKYALERSSIFVTALGRDFEITNELAGFRISMRAGNALYPAEEVDRAAGQRA
jgi:hypothetical protein